MSTTTLATIKTTMKHLQTLVPQLSEQQQVIIENTLQTMVARALFELAEETDGTDWPPEWHTWLHHYTLNSHGK